MPNYAGEHEDILLPYVDAMRYKLAANRKKGDSWKTTPVDAMLEKLVGEVQELREAIAGGNRTEIILEAADLGNFAMFIAAKALLDAANGRGTSDDLFGAKRCKNCGIGTTNEGSYCTHCETNGLVIHSVHFSSTEKTTVDHDHRNYVIQGIWQPTADPNDGRIQMWLHKTDGFIVYADHKYTREKKLLVAPWTETKVEQYPASDVNVMRAGPLQANNAPGSLPQLDG